MNDFIANIDTLFYTYKWKIPENLKNDPIFTLSNQAFGLLEFAEFVKSNTRLRMQGGENKDVKTTLKNMLKEYSNQKCLQFEEGKLEEKYPDFKALMREYREGILLFEATKIVVWDRASEDTAGLKMFHQKNKDKYRWEERAMLLTVSVDTTDKKLVDEVYNFARKNPIEKVFSKFDTNKKFISYQRTMVEKKGMEPYKDLSFSKNSVSKLHLNQDNTGYQFNKIEAIHPAGTKTLDEARGYIIADYQDHLEMMWVDELRKNMS
ncbi:MAG: hypothetical protein IPM34_02635 [Saprospiraceae bacterium]|nr:hypothetical protein [Saprospiraceae bacterium]